MKRIAIVILPVIFSGCLYGSSKLVDSNASLGTVDGRIITVAELDSVTGLLIKNKREGQDSTNIKSAAMDSLIIEKLIDIRTDSVASELNKDRDFVRQKEKNIGETAKKVLYQEKVSAAVNIDSSEITDYYENHKNDFMVPEQVEAKHILIRRPKPDTTGLKSEKARKKKMEEDDQFAKERAEGVLKLALAGDDWDSLAAIYSEDNQNASKGGDLGYFPRGRMVAEFDSVAFSTPPGEIVGPVATKFGYHIIKVEDHKEAAEKPLEGDVESQIKGILTRDKEKEIANAFVDSLKENGVYAFNHEVIDSDSTKFPNDTWVMTVNGTDTLFYDTYADALPRYMRYIKQDSLSVDDKMKMLDFMKTNLLLMSAVRTLGYFDNPEVARADDDYVRREARQRVNNMLRDIDYKPSTEEVESYYNDHINDYKVERKLLVYHIIFQDSTLAEAVRDSILLGADFADMAKKYYPGEPEIREVAYNLDYIGPKDMGEKFYSVADTLKVGDISHAIKTQWGYHIIKLVNRKEDRTLAQVKPGIEHALKTQRDDEKRQRIVDGWRSAAVIDIDSKLLNKYDPYASR